MSKNKGKRTLYCVKVSNDTKAKLLEMLVSQDKYDKTKAGKVYNDSDFVELIEEIISDRHFERYCS